jgi:hypothetical protein
LCGFQKRWLETDDGFRIEDPALRGIALPTDALERIYHVNFERLTGSRPRTLDVTLAVEECRRIAAGAQEPAEAGRAAELLGTLTA